MENFYVILDYENSQFALSGNFISVPDTPDKIPGTSSGNMLGTIIAIVVGVLVIIAIVGFIIVRQKNRRLQSNLSKYEQL